MIRLGKTVEIIGQSLVFRVATQETCIPVKFVGSRFKIADLIFITVDNFRAHYCEYSRRCGA